MRIQDMMKQFIHFQFEPGQVSSLQMDALLEAFDLQTISIPALRDYCGSVSPSRSLRMSKGPKSSLGSVNRVSR